MSILTDKLKGDLEKALVTCAFFFPLDWDELFLENLEGSLQLNGKKINPSPGEQFAAALRLVERAADKSSDENRDIYNEVKDFVSYKKADIEGQAKKLTTALSGARADALKVKEVDFPE